MLCEKIKKLKQTREYEQGEPIGLRLRVNTNGVDTLMDSFGTETKVRKNEDGTLTAMVSVSDSEGLYTWLMHHGKEVTVLEPEHVRKEMKRRLSKMLSNYEED